MFHILDQAVFSTVAAAAKATLPVLTSLFASKTTLGPTYPQVPHRDHDGQSTGNQARIVHGLRIHRQRIQEAVHHI
jgi:hypothetical protein